MPEVKKKLTKPSLSAVTKPAKKVLAKSATKVAEKPATNVVKQRYKTYLVGLCVIGFRQNLMITVKANNDYMALLGAMKKLRRQIADTYTTKSDMIVAAWEDEEKELTRRFKTYDSLKDFLGVAGFVVTTPYLLENPFSE